MIVLDEHLKGLGLEDAIRRWYRGQVRIVTDLRPGTIIKDEAVPMLLQGVSEPTFVTLNWIDFWGRLEPDARFCIACLTLPTGRAAEVPVVLRRLFYLPEFRSRAGRLGTIIRVSGAQVTHYRRNDPQPHYSMLPSR